MPQEYVDRIRKQYPGAYDDLNDQQLAAKVIERYPDYKDVLGDVAAGGSKSSASPYFSGLGETQISAPKPEGWFETVRDLATNAVENYLPIPRAEASAKPSLTPHDVATTVVPQTKTQAAIAAGTLAAGPAIGAAAKARVPAMAALSKVPALGRIFGGTVGGAIGGTVENLPSLDAPYLNLDATATGAAKGAALGAGSTAGGELLGKILGIGMNAPSALYRATNAGRRAINADDASAVGRAVGEIAPSLGGATTAEELHGLASGGQKVLGAAQDAGVAEVERMLGGRSVRVPALSDQPIRLQAAKDMLTDLANTANRTGDWSAYRQASAQLERGIVEAEAAAVRAGANTPRGPMLALPPASGTSVLPSSGTVFEARALTPREGIERTLEAASAAPGQSYREMAGQVVQPARTVPNERMAIVRPGAEAAQPATVGAGSTASPALGRYNAVQSDYRRGLALLENILKRPDLYRTPGGSELELAMDQLQTALRNPRVAAELQASLGAADFNRLVDAATRGAGLAAGTDVPGKPLSRLTGHLLASILGLGGGYAHGAGHGVGYAVGGEALNEGLRRGLPNLGAKYVGRSTGAAFPEPLQKVLDLVAQRAAVQNADALAPQGRSLVGQQ